MMQATDEMLEAEIMNLQSRLGLLANGDPAVHDLRGQIEELENALEILRASED